MNSQHLSKTLDLLCHAEQRSLIPRLQESMVFVSWASAEEAGAMRRINQEEREHVSWLIEMINHSGESPTPCTADVRTTSLHYVELSSVMPQALQNKKDLIQFYAQHAADLSASPEAVSLINRIIDRHNEHLQTLEAMSNRLEPISSAKD